MGLYPEHPWQPSHFVGSTKKPSGHWGISENQRELLQRIGTQLGVNKVHKYLFTLAPFPAFVSLFALSYSYIFVTQRGRIGMQ